MTHMIYFNVGNINLIHFSLISDFAKSILS